MTGCYRCGADDHFRRDCPLDNEPAGAPPEPRPARAEDFRRPEHEICPPERMHEIAALIRQSITGRSGPDWLWKRMQAWHQVAESRRDPLRMITQGYTGYRTVIGTDIELNGSYNGAINP